MAISHCYGIFIPRESSSTTHQAFLFPCPRELIDTFTSTLLGIVVTSIRGDGRQKDQGSVRRQQNDQGSVRRQQLVGELNDKKESVLAEIQRQSILGKQNSKCKGLKVWNVQRTDTYNR